MESTVFPRIPQNYIKFTNIARYSIESPDSPGFHELPRIPPILKSRRGDVFIAGGFNHRYNNNHYKLES